MIPRPRPHQKSHTDMLNTTRIHLKNDTTTMVSNLTHGHQLHKDLRNMRNSGNMEGGGGESATTNYRKRHAIGSMHNRRRMWK